MTNVIKVTKNGGEVWEFKKKENVPDVTKNTFSD